MSVLSTHLAITSPDHPIDAHMNGRIPVIAFQHVAAVARFEIHLNHLLTPAEQAAWLRKLAVQVEELAEQVETTAGGHAPDSSVKAIRSVEREAATVPPAVSASLARGLAQSAAGETFDLGSFAEYLTDDTLESKCRALVSDWQANAGSRPLGDPTADTWNDAARQLLDALAVTA